jgi:hypothetical protein
VGAISSILVDMMLRTVSINVYCEANGIFATLMEHRPDLPKPFDTQLQDWAQTNFNGCKEGEVIKDAGVFIYEPGGEIVEIRLT